MPASSKPVAEFHNPQLGSDGEADWATPRRMDDALLRVDVTVHAIGDCVAPRNMLIAIHERQRIACAI